MSKLTELIRKTIITVQTLKEKLKTVTLERFYESMLSEGEYLHKGKVIRAIQRTEPFMCNSGVNCPWTEELAEFNHRQKCLKCGKFSHGSGQ